MTYEIERAEEFIAWFDECEAKVQSIVARRIATVSLGSFGDWVSVGDTVSELRIHFGAGFRIYFTIRDRSVVILLVGGTKRTQAKDITKAKELAENL